MSEAGMQPVAHETRVQEDAELISREHEKQILRAERETERSGGAPPPSAEVKDAAGAKALPVAFAPAGSGAQADAEAQLRPELRDQLADVRALLKLELATENPDDACVTCSFQAEDVLLLKLVMELRPNVPVLFLDTGLHFAETYTYRDQIAQAWNLNLTNLLPQQTVAEQEAAFGKLYVLEPNRCCGLRKVEPLFEAVAQYRLWITGLRREQARSRTALKEVDDFAVKPGVVVRKLSPFADWSTRDVWELCAALQIPLLSLYEQGYTSIGCQPCTTFPTDPNDPRSGRWGGKKVECGIHIPTAENPAP